MSEFGPTMVILAMTLLCSLPSFSGLGISTLSVPSRMSLSGGRSLFLNLLEVPLHLRWASALPAVLLTLLFYLDQNISVRAVNSCSVKKGAAYHLDLLVLSGIVFLLSSMGLPWVCAATGEFITHLLML